MILAFWDMLGIAFRDFRLERSSGKGKKNKTPLK